MAQIRWMNFKRKKGGFTLVEALIAITILIVGILSAFILVTRALYSAAVIQDRLTASFLAQEGVELVRQIRDTNFLKSLKEGSHANWRVGLENGSYIVDITEPIELISVSSEQVPPLFYDGLTYNYDTSGQETPFKREIKISHIPGRPDEIRVEVIMKWRTRNINFDLTVEDHLFNWLKI